MSTAAGRAPERPGCPRRDARGRRWRMHRDSPAVGQRQVALLRAIIADLDEVSGEVWLDDQPRSGVGSGPDWRRPGELPGRRKATGGTTVVRARRRLAQRPTWRHSASATRCWIGRCSARPAANANASALARHWRIRHGCCCSTNRPPTSTSATRLVETLVGRLACPDRRLHAVGEPRSGPARDRIAVRQHAMRAGTLEQDDAW